MKTKEEILQNQIRSRFAYAQITYGMESAIYDAMEEYAEQDSFADLFYDWLDFSIETFKSATPEVSLQKLADEIEEVKGALKIYKQDHVAEEYADCLMCLLDSAARAKISVMEIKMAFKAKLEKNLKRKWKQNSNGTYSHE